jgi:regulator of sigma D
MINPQELISTLKSQHRTLQADLALVLKDVSPLPDLIKFKNDLLEHLKLENEVFYPDYIDKKTKRGEDVVKTKEFIRQMDDIGKVVMGFLDKYNTSEMINASASDFNKELPNIISTLNLRIETEEEGVFDLYLLL